MVVTTTKKEIFKYKIQRRYFKDSFWKKGWSLNHKNEWSEWYDCGSYNNLDVAHNVENIMNEFKTRAKYRTEYRLIKN